MKSLQDSFTIVDDCGVPIDGRMKVYDRNTSETVALKDADGNAIPNPVSVVNGKCVTQPFVDESMDLSVEIQVLVDTSNPSSDSSWECVQTSYSLPVKADVTNDSKGMYTVESVAAIRNADPDVVEAGHGCKALTYITSFGALVFSWHDSDEYNLPADNGADVLWYGTDGAWVASFQDLVDSRYFGVTTYHDYAVSADSKMSSFIARCSTIGKRPYFSKGVYNIGNNAVSGAVCDVGTVFCNALGDVGEVVDTDVKVYSNSSHGKISVVADDVRTSQDVKSSTNVSLKPRVRLIYDSVHRSGMTVSGVEVVLACNNVNAGNYTGCSFSGVGCFGTAGSFKNCRVKQSMFADSLDISSVTFIECSSYAYEWDDMGKFVKFCNENGTGVIDFCGFGIDELPSITSPVSVLNAVINDVSVECSGYTFRSCKFTEYFTCNSGNSFVGCIFSSGVKVKHVSGKMDVSFDGCTFVEGAVTVDFGSSLWSSISIDLLSITGCYFDEKNPLSLTSSLLQSVEVDTSNVYVQRNIGAKWNLDGSSSYSSDVGTFTADGRYVSFRLMDVSSEIEIPGFLTYGKNDWNVELCLGMRTNSPIASYMDQQWSESNEKGFIGRWTDMCVNQNVCVSAKIPSMSQSGYTCTVTGYVTIRRMK